MNIKYKGYTFEIKYEGVHIIAQWHQLSARSFTVEKSCSILYDMIQELESED